VKSVFMGLCRVGKIWGLGGVGNEIVLVFVLVCFLGVFCVFGVWLFVVFGVWCGVGGVFVLVLLVWFAFLVVGVVFWV
ncbi:hypothetical protein, partial [Escherichia coli]|uniref:hypothetical protein n=1 Tax=Escherichia coli TaxID=562 RepID=UPI00289FD2D0